MIMCRKPSRPAGVKIGFWKIALRPGKPFMYGRKGKTHVMGLPGNPVSALVTARIFLKPLLDRMMGLPTQEADTTAILGRHSARQRPAPGLHARHVENRA